jgi:putative IMPACT (imprinted ancient) family translation regulator
VPGLIHAYKTAAAEVLDQCGIIERNIEYAIRIQFDYTIMNDVQMVIRQFHCRINKQDMGLYCMYEIAMPLETKEKALQAFRELRGLEIL